MYILIRSTRFVPGFCSFVLSPYVVRAMQFFFSHECFLRFLVKIIGFALLKSVFEDQKKGFLGGSTHFSVFVMTREQR